MKINKKNIKQIRSIGWLHAVQGRVNLTVCFEFEDHQFLNISMDEFKKIKESATARLEFVLNNFSKLKSTY